MPRPASSTMYAASTASFTTSPPNPPAPSNGSDYLFGQGVALSRRRKSGQKFVKPDDHFAWGPFEIARFGKNLVWRSHANAEQVAAAQARAAEHYPAVVAEIDALVSSIATQVARLPPARLLQRAWWEHAGIVLGLGGKEVAESDQLAAMRM